MADRIWARVDVPAGPAKSMPDPDVVIIEERPDGIFLCGYTSESEFAGDTWHRDVAEAKAQASFAYGPTLGDWQVIPDDIADPVAYAIDQRRAG
jgi:hypothetical protein